MRIDEKKSEVKEEKQRTLHHLGVYWDVSLSREPTDEKDDQRAVGESKFFFSFELLVAASE